MPNAFQFNVEVNGVALSTLGHYLEWTLPPIFFISPLGLLTHGLIVGLGDEWQYANAAGDPGWVEDDL